MRILKVGDLQRISDPKVFDVITEIIGMNNDLTTVREVHVFYDNEKSDSEWSYREEEITDYTFEYLGDKSEYPEYFL